MTTRADLGPAVRGSAMSQAIFLDLFETQSRWVGDLAKPWETDRDVENSPRSWKDRSRRSSRSAA